MTRPVLYYSQDCPEAMEEALAYIKREGFTRDDVRLIRKQGALIVEALRFPESWRKKDATI